MTPPRAPRLAIGPLRLRSKLVLSLALAALVPAVLVAILAMRVIGGNLEQGLRRDAARQREVGLNLVLRSIEKVGDDLFRIADRRDPVAATQPDLRALVDLEPAPTGLLQVTDGDGKPLAQRGAGVQPAQVDVLRIASDDPAVTSARGFARRVTLVVRQGQLIARASAPIVDGSLRLQGVAVLSVLLDGDAADRIAAALGANIIIATADQSWATFRDADGQRVPVPAHRFSATAIARGRAESVENVRGPSQVEPHQVAWIALVDRDRVAIAWLGVAVPRRVLAAAQAQAVQSMVLAGLGALVFALGLALFLARRLGRPIARLHTGAIAVARGDLDHRIDVPPGDEIADLATAFAHMTRALKENQARLAARMREIVALHDAGRAVSAEIDLAAVSQRAVDSIGRAFEARLCALWLVDADGDVHGARGLTLVAARGRRGDAAPAAAQEAALAASSYQIQAEEVVADRTQRRRRSVADRPADGPLLALPLEGKDQLIGVIVIARGPTERGFTEADASLLATFADQAASALDNARLYAQVRGASEDLERKVRLRTAELTAINGELGRALAELRDAQAQLVLSERMAGLGLLVASVAHEINSPSAAIRGSVDAFSGVVRRIGSQFAALAAADISAQRHRAILAMLDELAPTLGDRRLASGPGVRQHARALRATLEARGALELAALAPRLAELGLDDDDVAVLERALDDKVGLLGEVVLDSLSDHAFLHRTAETIRHAIGRIQRIVGALKSYSHLDRDAARVPADLHEGIETTLTLFDHALRDIDVQRRFAVLPPVPIFADELNQVWTNLIQNAVQALGGTGSITIESSVAENAGDAVAVIRVIDDGPGMPATVLPHIFEPFFTTKRVGEGSGLGLGIVRQIVTKHGGQVRCESTPGRTMFEVRLPIGALAIQGVA